MFEKFRQTETNWYNNRQVLVVCQTWPRAKFLFFWGLANKSFMSDKSYKYIWRCAKCSYHFANVISMEGVLRQEKKCPKCKSLNMIALQNREIYIQCKLFDPSTNGYRDDIEDNYTYPL